MNQLALRHLTKLKLQCSTLDNLTSLDGGISPGSLEGLPFRKKLLCVEYFSSINSNLLLTGACR